MRTEVRKLLAAALIGGSTVGAIAVHGGVSGASGPAIPAHYAAPYLQIATSDQGDMAADMAASGNKYYTLAFLTPKSGCTPMWEDGNFPVGQFVSVVKSLQSKGGEVLISFGGAAGGEIAETCTSVSTLEKAYANVVNLYGATRLDFDIEGNYLNNTAANTRRNQALAQLQKADPAVQVDYTLPVNPTGLAGNGIAILKNAVSNGVKVNLVNIMTMDFGNGQNALADAESAANATHGQLGKIFAGVSSSQLWDMIGLTPIAGKNDDNEVFTQANAATLESFAASKGVGELSFWEVDAYDKKVGYAYSKIFVKITS
ncbi:MAG TPA: chitinase [Acidimicrobiales bacterium]|nr:chitinase [Acidimicrobiales bacterium]